MPSPKPVILDHDGGHDDLVALALLLASTDKVRVIGSIVTDADCFVEHGFQVTGKLMALMHKQESTDLFPIGRSSFTGVNPFPSDWRWNAVNMGDLPSMNIPENVSVWKQHEEGNRKHVGEQLLASLVMNSPEKVTICVTGPLSNVAWCIEEYGEAFTSNVEECIIMGGALDVKGNVFVEGRTDGSAEWNIFWDPPAAKTVLSCPRLRNVLFSLDSTNHVPVNSEVVQRFGAQNEYVLSQFIGSAWSSCTHFTLMRPGDGYYAWDVLTAAYALDASLAQLDPVQLDVVVTKDASEGRTVRKAVQAEGADVAVTHVARDTNAARFYDLVIASSRRCRTRS